MTKNQQKVDCKIKPNTRIGALLPQTVKTIVFMDIHLLQLITHIFNRFLTIIIFMIMTLLWYFTILFMMRVKNKK